MKLHSVYIDADTGNPAGTADRIDSLIDDLVALRDYMKEKGDELDG